MSPDQGPLGSGPLAQQALQILQQGGPSAVNGFFDDIRRHTGLRLTLFDAKLNTVAGARTDESVHRLAAQALSTGHMQMSSADNVFVHADAVVSDNGDEFVLVDVASPGHIDYATAAIRIVLVVAVATLICWWLSRQITLPIIALRIAARDLAAGRFGTRVAARTGNRRDEIGDLATEFDVMSGRLESMVDAQNRLLGDVSHELRSPLARLSVASAIARRKAGPDSSPALDRVDQEVARLNDLIGQLMLMSKLEVDAAARGDTDVDVGKVLAGVCSDAQFEAQSFDKKISLDINATEVVIRGNEELLRSAFENVVRNALRYTKPGTAVEARLSRKAASIEIEVRDHGDGVPEAELANIFKPFYRTAEARDRDSGGVGLGLAITQRAVRRHRGSVEAANAVGGGLLVTIDLPSTAAVV
jgi:two-component system sensor histidine kinase CpxA